MSNTICENNIKPLLSGCDEPANGKTKGAGVYGSGGCNGVYESTNCAIGINSNPITTSTNNANNTNTLPNSFMDRHHHHRQQQQQQQLQQQSEDITNSSIIEFLNNEQKCLVDNENDSELDIDSIFEEIHRLSGDSDRSVEDIIKEAEMLMNRNDELDKTFDISLSSSSSLTTLSSPIQEQRYPHQQKHQQFLPFKKNAPKVHNNINNNNNNNNNINVKQKPISLESTPREMKHGGDLDKLDNNNSSDEVQEITHELTNIDINKNDDNQQINNKFNTEIIDAIKLNDNHTQIMYDKTIRDLPLTNGNSEFPKAEESALKPINGKMSPATSTTTPATTTTTNHREQLNSRRNSSSLENNSNVNKSIHNESPEGYRKEQQRRVSLTSKSKSKSSPSSSSSSSSLCPTPTKNQLSNSMTTSQSFSRERTLEHDIELLQEKLKDTEERLQSLKIQHDSLSQIHRTLRENNSQLQDESERLKIEVQHLTECANILRNELQLARNDRTDANEIQKILQKQLDDNRDEKKRSQDQSDKDAKTIQDLHRQCKEMERILMRKHPDSVSALIVASKNPSNSIEDNSSCRRLLEQRIAQLESDAKEQDQKAQKILTNVQSKFSSVQSKYETHISDLETQVLNLQQINAQLNEKIEYQSESLRNYRKHEMMMNENTITNYTQTHDIAEKDIINTVSTSTQTEFKVTVATKQLPNTKKIKPLLDTNKEDAHLLSTIRGMRVDLAIKEKALQRLTRELDECKKTIKKLQKEKDGNKNNYSSTIMRKSTDNIPNETNSIDSNNNTNNNNNNNTIILHDTLNKMKILEYDYKALHDKRLQDLKTLQAAHERELIASHETVRVLEQRLAEREETAAIQKRRKVPIDYFALKEKVSSLEQRHTEREQRLHLLVEVLSRGRIPRTFDEDINQNK